MFGIVRGLTRAVVNTALTPVTAVADVATLGGLMTDRREPYTATALKDALRGLEEAVTDEDPRPRRR